MSYVIAGFPGVGKTTMTKELGKDRVSDSDSSKFDKANFPQNYIEHIQNLIKEGKEYILVSSHKEVREALQEADIDYLVVYPDISLKEEYLDRYRARGSSEEFIKLLSENWENWIEDIMNSNENRWYLSDHETLTTEIDDIVKFWNY